MYALLVAPDGDEAAVLSLVLQRSGLAVTSARSIERAVQTWSERPADLVLAALAADDPVAQVNRIRSETVVPLAIVVDPLQEELHYALLEAGADMVIQRPFSARLLVAQMRSLLRRSGGVPLIALPTLSLSGLTVDPATHMVSLDNQPSRRLTHLEFRLLYTLMMHRGQVLTTDIIVQRVWGYADDAGSRELVRGLVSRLRGKVEPDPRQPRYIRTVPGVGYVFEADEATAGDSTPR
ncbi:MAG TPA: response regulator transcription factor [Anaerolineae bacterium]|nr:response regulator transcription factor [Anaerolineae bacterium]